LGGLPRHRNNRPLSIISRLQKRMSADSLSPRGKPLGHAVAWERRILTRRFQNAVERLCYLLLVIIRGRVKPADGLAKAKPEVRISSL
jgi:hypothetical protein